MNYWERRRKYALDAISAMVSYANSVNPDKESQEYKEKQGMGTTVVAATIIGDKMYVANVGDSRLYVINQTIEQITNDHSYVEEMIRIGKIKREEAAQHEKKNVITRAVGATEKVKVDFFEVELRENDVILLCSDGLTNMVSNERIYQIVSSHSEVDVICKALIDEANKNGGQDNITAVVVRP